MPSANQLPTWSGIIPVLNVGSRIDPTGSAKIISQSLFIFLNAFPAPVIVPPVPTPAQKASTLLDNCCKISGPVHLKCAFKLA